MKKARFVLLLAVALAGPCHASCSAEAQAAAAAFMNDYLRHLLAVESGKSPRSSERWVLDSKAVSRRFKNTYKAFIKDPDQGFDPLLDAQDFPNKGWIPAGCDAPGFVTLRTKPGDHLLLPVVVKILKNGNGWLIDGAGIINIPESKRPPGD